MTRDELTEFLDEVRCAFYAGDVDALVKLMRLPLGVYSAVGVVVLRNREEFARMVEDYRAAIVALEVVDGRQTILSLDPAVNNRMRATVRNVDVNAEGKPVTGSTIRYFFVENEQGLAVEMLEYLEAPLPISDIEKIVH